MQKDPDAFRTISEVADDLDIPQHVLRFWETRFTTIRPLKRGGGRRYYRPDDVDLLRGIRHLLYDRGYTIKGVQRILKEDGARFVQGVGRGEQAPPDGARPDGDGPDDATQDGSEEVGTGIGDTTGADGADRLPGSIIPDDAPDGGTALAGDEIRQLRAALDELLECERVLGSLRAE